jgi:hypothetical protein
MNIAISTILTSSGIYNILLTSRGRYSPAATDESFYLAHGFIEIGAASFVCFGRSDRSLKLVNCHHTQGGMADFCAFEDRYRQ